MAELTVTYDQFKSIKGLLPVGFVTIYALNPDDNTKVVRVSVLSASTDAVNFQWTDASEQPTETIFLLDFVGAAKIAALGG